MRKPTEDLQRKPLQVYWTDSEHRALKIDAAKSGNTVAGMIRADVRARRPHIFKAGN